MGIGPPTNLRYALKTMRISLFVAIVAALVGASTAAATPPSTGQTLTGVSASGTSRDGSTATLSVSWGYSDAAGEITYQRPCAVFVNTVNGTPTAGTPTFAVGEDDTSWSGDVAMMAGTTVYVGFAVAQTPIGVAGRDCSHPSYTGFTAVAVPAWAPPVSEPAGPANPPPVDAPTTTTAPTTTGPTVDQRVTDLELRVAALEASWAAYTDALAAGASAADAALASRSAALNVLYGLS